MRLIDRLKSVWYGPWIHCIVNKNGIGFTFGPKGLRLCITRKGIVSYFGIAGRGFPYIKTRSSSEEILANPSYKNICISKVAYRVDFKNDVFRKLAALSDISLDKALEFYNRIVGIGEDSDYRIFKKTGERYIPNEEQLKLERLLMDKWEIQRDMYRIDKRDYVASALVFGLLAFHRFRVNHWTEGFFRVGLLALFLSIHPKIVFLVEGICFVEAYCSYKYCKEDEIGKIVRFGILDLIERRM